MPSSDNQVLLSIDQGTTSSRALVFSFAGDVLFSHQIEFPLIMPKKGWVEQGPMQILKDVRACVQACVAFVNEQGLEIVSCGITNQRETVVVWDRSTGIPVYNAIVWQDGRTADYFKTLDMDADLVARKTGLKPNPYFSASKIRWILDEVGGTYDNLICGTIDCFLLWHLTEGAVHATDITNASRTLLYNVQEEKWDAELLDIFNIPQAMLPDVHENIAEFGQLEIDGLRVPISGMAGDQHAALIGQACFERGDIKSTYGTGCFALLNIGEDFRVSESGLLTTIGYKINGQKAYALEGSIFMAGALVQWLRDSLGIIKTSGDSEEIALSVNDNNGVYLVPAFTGLGAPYWEAKAQGILTGLTRDCTRAHIVRAGLEAQAYQTYDLLDAMQNDSGVQVRSIRADGGLMANNFVCQFIADMTDCMIEVPKQTEATAWGAAILAGLGAGVFENLDGVKKLWKADRMYKPNMDVQIRTDNLSGWMRAVKQVLAGLA